MGRQVKSKFSLPLSGDSNFVMTGVKNMIVFKHFTDCGTQVPSDILIHEASGVFSEQNIYFSC